jgi:excisionase family DNA binding protein
MDKLPEWLTLGEAARYLGIPRSVLCSWVEAKKISGYITPTGTKRFLAEDIKKFITKNTN